MPASGARAALEHLRDIGAIMLQSELDQPVAQRQDALYGLVLGQIVVVVGVLQVPVGDLQGLHALGVRPHDGKFRSRQFRGGQRISIVRHGGLWPLNALCALGISSRVRERRHWPSAHK
jgi:hypothetical protein